MATSALTTQLIAHHPRNHARVMQVQTAHGCFTTPAFMPVGTRAGVTGVTTQDLKLAGSQIILGGNTYHMLVAPGMEIIEDAGGMHRFMGWDGPMLTDSGGFQVFSLSRRDQRCVIDENGAYFQHPSRAETLVMTPEVSIQTQKVIGADIIMAFDQCMPDDLPLPLAQDSVARTHRWLLRSLEYHQQHPGSLYGYQQALFGIIQGGTYRELRQHSASFVTGLPLDGFAIGGETIGFDMEKTQEVIDWVRPLLPAQQLRYTMGVGMSPQDLLDVVAAGMDMFDCVAPTRNARHGALFSGEFVIENDWPRFDSPFPRGRLSIKQAQYAADDSPVMASCDCFTCQNYSRAQLHYLFKHKSVLYTALASLHNVAVMHEATQRMRSLCSWG